MVRRAGESKRQRDVDSDSSSDESERSSKYSRADFSRMSTEQRLGSVIQKRKRLEEQLRSVGSNAKKCRSLNNNISALNSRIKEYERTLCLEREVAAFRKLFEMCGCPHVCIERPGADGSDRVLAYRDHEEYHDAIVSQDGTHSASDAGSTYLQYKSAPPIGEFGAPCDIDLDFLYSVFDELDVNDVSSTDTDVDSCSPSSEDYLSEWDSFCEREDEILFSLLDSIHQ